MKIGKEKICGMKIASEMIEYIAMIPNFIR